MLREFHMAQGFCKCIRRLVHYMNILYFNLSIHDSFAYEVVMNFDILRVGVKHWIVRQFHHALLVAVDYNAGVGWQIKYN